MKNDIYGFNVDYHQIGHSEDLEDWIYTYTMKNIILQGLVPLKYVGSSCPNKSVNEILKDLLAIIPNSQIVSITKHAYRMKMSYIFSDTKNHLTYLNLSHHKREKTESVEFEFTTAIPEVAVDVEKYIKENFSNDKKNAIYVIAQSSGGLNLHNLGVMDIPFQRENYSDHVVSGYDHVVKEFNKKEPFGRLAIFNGPPGTGKTYLLKSLIGQIKDCIIVLLPSKLVGEVDSPALITLLAEQKAEYGTFDPEGEGKSSLPILFIIEDADACLVPRESDNILTISSLLNYTDGILGSMLDLRVIATTNQESIQFDEALTRPGRLCRHIYVGSLSPEKASEVYKRVSGGEEKIYKKETSLAHVYADVNGGFEVVDVPKNVMGFGSGK